MRNRRATIELGRADFSGKVKMLWRYLFLNFQARFSRNYFFLNGDQEMTLPISFKLIENKGAPLRSFPYG